MTMAARMAASAAEIRACWVGSALGWSCWAIGKRYAMLVRWD